VKRFQYKISGQGKEETIWVCAACKKAHLEEILLGKMKIFHVMCVAEAQAGNLVITSPKMSANFEWKLKRMRRRKLCGGKN